MCSTTSKQLKSPALGSRLGESAASLSYSTDTLLCPLRNFADGGTLTNTVGKSDVVDGDEDEEVAGAEEKSFEGVGSGWDEGEWKSVSTLMK